jgi:Fe-S-cluster containining protein
MQCRNGCGACCIAPSINSPLPGMPDGKPAGVNCIHLSNDYLCKIFTDPERPDVCDGFKASMDVCGTNRIEALQLISVLEIETCPN